MLNLNHFILEDTWRDVRLIFVKVRHFQKQYLAFKHPPIPVGCFISSLEQDRVKI